MTPATMLAAHIDRVVATVLRTLEEMPVVHDGEAAEAAVEADAQLADVRTEAEMTDLCGHVAIALRGLEMHTGSLATYIRPGPQQPTLDVRR